VGSGLFRGHVDIISRQEIKGWAHDVSDAERSVVVELVEGDIVLARTTANIMRKDLADAGVGTGRYGFAFILGEHVFPFARHRLRVRFADDGMDVPGSPFALVDPGRPGHVDVSDVAEILHSRIETLDEPDTLNRMIGVLAGALDRALSRQWDKGRPVLSDAAPTALGEPKSFAEAVEQAQHRYPRLDVTIERKPVVSVVVPSHNQFADAYAAIQSVLTSRPAAPVEIILVDDGSSDETLIARAVLPPAIRTHRTPSPMGRTAAYKAGQALAQGRYVLFLDPRARLAPGCIDTLLSVFSDVPAAGVVGPRLLQPDGTVGALGAELSFDAAIAGSGSGLEGADPRGRHRREVDVVPGHALLIDKAVSVRVRGYDERFSATAYADCDLAMRVRAVNRTVIVQPSATAVIALDPATLDPSSALAIRTALAQDRKRFGEIWHESLSGSRFEAGRDPTARDAVGHALVIDHSFPTPWSDAGSAAVVSHIRALQDLGYKVSFVPGGPADMHPKATPALERFGVACFYKPAFQGVVDVLREIGGSLDVVYIHRLSNARGYLDDVRRLAPRARVVFSVADLHYLREERQAELTGDALLKDAAQDQRAAELAVAAKVDAIITHSSVEAAMLRAELPGATVAVVPWLIPSVPVKRPVAERSGLAFVGSYRHAPNLDAARWLVEEIMPLVHARNPSIVCYLVGEGLPDDLQSPERPWLRVLGWVSDLHEQVYERVRLTVAPLRFGAGVKGKVLESLAVGVPCVMTTLAAEGIPLPAGARGWIRDQAADFADAIVAMHDGALTSEPDIADARAAIQLMCSASNVKNMIGNVVTLQSEAKMDTNTSDPSDIASLATSGATEVAPDISRASVATAY
jgi:glycosyltransferase involved in cell wall biosynthesis